MSWASYSNLRAFGQKNIPILDSTTWRSKENHTPAGIIGSSALSGKSILDGTLEKTTLPPKTNALKLSKTNVKTLVDESGHSIEESSEKKRRAFDKAADSALKRFGRKKSAKD